MKKVFISQPMKDIAPDLIRIQRNDAIDYVQSFYEDEIVEVLDSYFEDFEGNRLQFLGKSIQDCLSQADVAVFVGDWYKYDGCICEFIIAARYGLKCLFVDWGEPDE